MAPSAVKEISRWQLFARGCHDGGTAAGGGGGADGGKAGRLTESDSVRCGRRGGGGAHALIVPFTEMCLITGNATQKCARNGLLLRLLNRFISIPGAMTAQRTGLI